MKHKLKYSKLVKCLCGGIKLKTKGKLRHVINCHCYQCLKTHGNYSSYTAILEKDVQMISKKTLKWYQSSLRTKRGFCSKCGASIFFKHLESESVSISAGMFQHPTNLKTKYNIFTIGKMDYYKLDNRIQKYNKYPK